MGRHARRIRDSGYTPFQLATIFVFYELFGIITNLVGGWLAARFGLKFTLFSGLIVQIVALSMLALAPEAWLVVPYVMASQALSGIAKDLTKMSSKSAVKLVVADGDEGALFRWVSILTGSKNALKGVGFFLGGVLLTLVGFQTAMLILAAIVLVALIATSTMMHGGLGTVNAKAKFHHMFSQNRAVNVLAAARIFLFASRDVWFVVGLPVFAEGHGEPDGRTAALIAFVLAFFPAAIAIALSAGVDQTFAIIVGLAAFGVIFAVNSAVHSYLILSYSQGDKVAMNVGFYYMANAAGRLIGTLLSGLLYQWQGLTACLWASVIFVIAAGLLSLMLPNQRAGAGSRASLSSNGASSETALTA